MEPKRYNPVLENKAVSSILLHADPLWDSSPIKLPGWYTLLLKDITNENAAFDTLLKYGFIATSRGVACASAGQAAALEDSSYGPYTYQDPSPIDPSTEMTVMAKVAAGCTFHADKADTPVATHLSAPGKCRNAVRLRFSIRSIDRSRFSGML